MAFCDFCECVECLNGRPGLKHAQTAAGTWICDVCYDYDVCVRAKKMLWTQREPCVGPCEHRPQLVTEWMEAEQSADPPQV